MTVTIPQLVQRVRRLMHDNPTRTFVKNSPSLASNGASLTLPAGAASLFPAAGMTLEFDDGTDEQAITTASGDRTTDTVALARGQNGTTAAAHTLNTAALLGFRFGYSEIAEALNLILDTEFWPYVWVPGETTLTPNLSSEYYPSAVAGIEEVSYAYQLQSGFEYSLPVDWLSTVFADNTNFALGAFFISPSYLVDGSTLYVAYRARASITTLTSSMEHLAAMGAAAHLLMMEEGALVGPDSAFVERRLAEGSRSKAGLLLWQRFEQARGREHIALEHEEDKRRSVFKRRGA